MTRIFLLKTHLYNFPNNYIHGGAVRKAKRILIPSINFDDVKSIRSLSRHFREVELDLYGLDKKLPPPEMARLEKAKGALEDSGMRAYSVHLRSFDMSSSDNDAKLNAFIRSASFPGRVPRDQGLCLALPTKPLGKRNRRR